MRQLKYIAFSALLILWGGALQAAHSIGMYEAEVEVADQGRQTRAEAMSEAMAAVLLKVGGRSSLLEEEVLKSAMTDASRYVQQYRYRSEERPPEQRGEGGSASEQRLLLWVSFDSASIDSLLRRFGFNVWSAARPSTLLWLAVEEGGRRQLVGANDQGLVREVLDTEAQRRAIPLRLPLLDLSDQSKVRSIDVWGGFIDNIEDASARYETQAILIGKIYPQGKIWESRWTLLYQGERSEWEYASSDVSTVVASGVGATADYLSSYFASTSYSGRDQLILNIDAVNSMSAFRRVHNYLMSLHGVTAVKLRRTNATAASFLLDIEGGRETLIQAIHLGDVLVEIEPPPRSEHYPSSGALPVEPESATTPSADRMMPTEPAAGQSAPELSPLLDESTETVAEIESSMQAEGVAGEAVIVTTQPQAAEPTQELFFRLLP